MTMEHVARSFEVSLSITHPDINPTQISAAIGLVPRRMSRAGEPRASPKGDPLGGAYGFSCWTHCFDVKGARELGLALEGLVERLEPHSDFLRKVSEEGGKSELFCGVFAAGNWDEILPYTLMRRFAELHLDLRLDVYPKHDAKVA